MQAIKFIFAATLLSVCLYSSAIAQSPEDMNKSREFERNAIADYKAKNLPGFLVNIRKAGELRPNHPRLVYNLAAALALNNQPDEAMTIIKRMVTMGLYFPLEKDDDFRSLGPDKLEYVKKIFAENLKPVDGSTRAFTLPDKELIPESVAYDPVSGKFYVSSIHKGKIVSLNADGSTTDLSTPADGLWSVSGMKIDGKRRLLWAGTTAFSQMKGYNPANEGRSGIVKYDLATGKLIKKYLLPAGEKHGLGDLTLDDAGNVYAADSVGAAIYRIDRKKDELELFLTDPMFVSLQGITFTRDEKTLFVADYAKGLFKIDMTTKKVVQIVPGEYVTLIGIDGLYMRKGVLIAIQNGINPHRVVAIGLSPDRTRALGTKTLEANHSDFLEPTLGVLIGDEFYYIANSQWPLVNEKAELQTDKLREPVILKLKQ